MGSLTRTIAVAFVCFSWVQNSASGDYKEPRNPKEPHLNLSTLKFVSVIARHGSRADFSSFPNDPSPPENPALWPFGPGQLTKLGRQQAYALGQNLRQRYNGFIGSIYTKKETLFQSNLNSRDMMSAALIAAGMYPPARHEIWNETWTDWQPVEVWPEYIDTDTLKSECPAFRKWMIEACEVVSDQIYNDNREFIDLMVELSGFDFLQVKRRPISVFDPIFFEKQNGLPSPFWANDAVMGKLYEIGSKLFVTEQVGSLNQLQVVAGPIVKILLEQLANATDEKTKLIVLAAHDATIVAIKFAFGITEYLLPFPASSLAVELHNNGIDSFVQMMYFNDSSTTVPTLLELPECPHPCRFEEFAEIGSRVIIDNWEEKCHETSGSSVASVSIVLLIASSLSYTMNLT